MEKSKQTPLDLTVTEYQSEVAPKRLELKRNNVDKNGMYNADKMLLETYQKIFKSNLEAIQYELDHSYKGSS